MFHPERAAELGVSNEQLSIGELDQVEVIELNREIAMSCHRWIFERRVRESVPGYRSRRTPARLLSRSVPTSRRSTGPTAR